MQRQSPGPGFRVWGSLAALHAGHACGHERRVAQLDRPGAVRVPCMLPSWNRAGAVPVPCVLRQHLPIRMLFAVTGHYHGLGEVLQRQTYAISQEITLLMGRRCSQGLRRKSAAMQHLARAVSLRATGNISPKPLSSVNISLRGAQVQPGYTADWLANETGDSYIAFGAGSRLLKANSSDLYPANPLTALPNASFALEFAYPVEGVAVGDQLVVRILSSQVSCS